MNRVWMTGELTEWVTGLETGGKGEDGGRWGDGASIWALGNGGGRSVSNDPPHPSAPAEGHVAGPVAPLLDQGLVELSAGT